MRFAVPLPVPWCNGCRTGRAVGSSSYRRAGDCLGPLFAGQIRARPFFCPNRPRLEPAPTRVRNLGNRLCGPPACRGSFYLNCLVDPLVLPGSAAAVALMCEKDSAASRSEIPRRRRSRQSARGRRAQAACRVDPPPENHAVHLRIRAGDDHRQLAHLLIA